ncbi:MAG: ArdC-like ssDNA-binding domain-containing protein [Acidimicrobiales bacterium]
MGSTAKHAELLDTLSEGIAQLGSSEKWTAYLDMQSRFHRYSFGNTLLIASQRPAATQVAGFNAWKKLGRSVRKGEKAIFILAPMIYTDSTDPDSSDEAERNVRGFKFVPVFDVAQTDGEELASICNRIEGSDPAGHYARLVQYAAVIGFSVEDHSFESTTNGDCCHQEHRIRVEVANAPAQRVKTLAHEIAHALLHEGIHDRALGELEAESSAYVVCQALGLDTTGYSFGYVTTWAGGPLEAIEGIKASARRIQQSADQILNAVELQAVEEAA